MIINSEHVPPEHTEDGGSEACRSAGRRMSSNDNAQLEFAGTSELAGSPLGRSRVGVVYLGRQVVAPVMPGDVVVPSNIYPRE